MISVAMCTYNGGRFVRGQIDSILAQSRPVDEIIVCDDGSTDDTESIVRAYGGPVRWVRNESQLRVTKNFEKAISLCSGEIIFLSDQDDRWKPDKVERLMRELDNPEVGIAFSNARVVGDDGNPLGYRLWDSVWFTRDEQAQFARGEAIIPLLKHAIVAGSTMAFKSELKELVLPIPDFKHSHDIWITLLGSFVTKVAAVDEDLIDYRIHGANVVGLKKHSLLSQVRMAKHQLNSGAFKYAKELHEAARERLKGRAVRGEWLRLLEEKIEHSRVRDEMGGFLGRMPSVWREWRRGNYSKYSYGGKSVLQDLFLR